MVGADEPEVGMHLLEILAAPRWAPVRQRLAERAEFAPLSGGSARRLIQQWLRLLENTTARTDIRVGDRVTCPDLERSGRPLLAIYGERSPNRATGLALEAGHKNCTLVTVADAGHYHPLTRSTFFWDTVTCFLDHAADLPVPRREHCPAAAGNS
jgi:pimeloyl-ACP methyl ester carboxylesterase